MRVLPNPAAPRPYMSIMVAAPPSIAATTPGAVARRQ